MKSSIKTIKDHHLDELCSKLCRLRTNYYCERCGTNHRQAQWSHLMGRRSRNTRWAPDNCATHCAYCHRYLTENPYEFGKWIVGHLGKEAAEELERRAHTTRKRSQAEKRDLYNKMKSEYVRMEEHIKKHGHPGRLEYDLEGL